MRIGEATLGQHPGQRACSCAASVAVDALEQEYIGLGSGDHRERCQNLRVIAGQDIAQQQARAAARQVGMVLRESQIFGCRRARGQQECNR
ncbi:hypothetical protein GCM10023209_23150 [Roseibacterium beibuensis]|uniref:Uncharacterized protein n=1 Tax=[Roseibacterium] beibuensis TaxID=1193142 RepID=A0ABP9LFP0_9RHOB